MEDFNIDTIIDHIILIKQKEQFKERKEIYNIEDELKRDLFDCNDITINQISPTVEETNKDFYENHNKMILLSVLFSLNEEFRNINFLNQMNLINSIYEANIKNYITTKNEKNKRFYKIEKKSLSSYYENNEYSNAMIDLYANILNINIFIIEYNNGKYYIGLFSLTEIFNPNKPSIIIWHPNKLMYYPISYKDNFKFYKSNEIFNKFLKHKIFFMQPNKIENNLLIKNVNVSFETPIIEDYDNDLNIIYIYKTTLPRKLKNKTLSSSKNLIIDNEENKNDIEIIKNNIQENIKEDIDIKEDTETNIKKVMIITDPDKIYTREELNKFTIQKIKDMMSENQILIKGLKKKDQFIETYLNWQKNH